MEKIEGHYYSYRKEKCLDLTSLDYIRFNIDCLNYIDVRFKDGVLNINGSYSIQIMPAASNSIGIKIKEPSGM